MGSWVRYDTLSTKVMDVAERRSYEHLLEGLYDLLDQLGLPRPGRTTAPMVTVTISKDDSGQVRLCILAMRILPPSTPSPLGRSTHLRAIHPLGSDATGDPWSSLYRHTDVWSTAGLRHGDVHGVAGHWRDVYSPLTLEGPVLLHIQNLPDKPMNVEERQVRDKINNSQTGSNRRYSRLILTSGPGAPGSPWGPLFPIGP